MAPDTRERRPARGGVPGDAHGDGIGVRITASAGLRRRRAASWRFPPFDSGHRDPLDKLAGLPIDRRAEVCRGEFGAGGKWRPCCRRGAA